MTSEWLLPGIAPVVPGYWITFKGREAFVSVDDQGHIIGISSVDGEVMSMQDFRRFSSVTVTNMIAAVRRPALESSTQ